MTNLEMLKRAEEGLDAQQKLMFDAYFIGALAILSKQSDWESALVTAAACVRKFGPQPTGEQKVVFHGS